METDKRIQILLSSYNGEKYLREQLDSLISQSVFDRIKVFIRDDGSSDGTRDILLEYKKKYGFEVMFGDNVGCNKSVLCLLKNCDKSCDYYALCDQDDVWFNDKIERAVRMLDSHFSEDKPVLYASRSTVTDEKLRPVGMSLMPSRGLAFYNAAIQNVCPGHTQVFNNCMMRLLGEQTDSDNIFVIDYWIYQVASSMGTVLFDEKAAIYHRQHGDNAVGYSTNFFLNTLKRLRRLSFKKKDPSAAQLALFLKTFDSRIPSEYSKEIKRFFSSQKNICAKLKYACTTKFFRQSRLDTAAFKVLYLLGKYDL